MGSVQSVLLYYYMNSQLYFTQISLIFSELKDRVENVVASPLEIEQEDTNDELVISSAFNSF